MLAISQKPPITMVITNFERFWGAILATVVCCFQLSQREWQSHQIWWEVILRSFFNIIHNRYKKMQLSTINYQGMFGDLWTIGNFILGNRFKMNSSDRDEASQWNSKIRFHKAAKPSDVFVMNVFGWEKSSTNLIKVILATKLPRLMTYAFKRLIG